MFPVFDATASWYGPECQGRLTSCGEVFDYEQLTCAHQYLPMGSVLLVWYENRYVVVVVNDRIPAYYGREIDLSMAAFKQICDLDTGVIHTRYIVLGRWLRPSMRYNLEGLNVAGRQERRGAPDQPRGP